MPARRFGENTPSPLLSIQLLTSGITAGLLSIITINWLDTSIVFRSVISSCFLTALLRFCFGKFWVWRKIFRLDNEQVLICSGLSLQHVPYVSGTRDAEVTRQQQNDEDCDINEIVNESSVLQQLLANESDIDAIFLADATKVYDSYLKTRTDDEFIAEGNRILQTYPDVPFPFTRVDFFNTHLMWCPA